MKTAFLFLLAYCLLPIAYCSAQTDSTTFWGWKPTQGLIIRHGLSLDSAWEAIENFSGTDTTSLSNRINLKQNILNGSEPVFAGWDKTSSDDYNKSDSTTLTTIYRLKDSLSKIRDSLAVRYTQAQVNSLLALKYNKSDSTSLVTIYRLIDSLAALRNSLVLKDSNSYAVPSNYSLLGLKLSKILAGNGTALLPSYSFSNSTNSGMWRSGNGKIYISQAGDSTKGINVDLAGNTILSGLTVANASVTSLNDIVNIRGATGQDVTIYYREGTTPFNYFPGITIKNGGGVNTSNGTVLLPSYSFSNSTNSGMWRSGNGNIYITQGGDSAKGLTLTPSGGVYVSGLLSVTGTLYTNNIVGGSANRLFINGSGSLTTNSYIIGGNFGLNTTTPLYKLSADLSGTASDTTKTGFLFVDINQNTHRPTAAAARDTSAIYDIVSATGNHVFGIVNKDGVTIFKADSANIYFPALDSLKRKSANTLYVGLNMRYPTISSAITGASNYNVIEITNGTYTENLTINKDITIVGTGSVIIKGKVTVTDTAVIKNVSLINNALSTDTVLSVRSFCKLENVNIRGLLNSVSGKIEHLRGVQYGGANLTGSSVYNADLDSMSTGGFSNNDFNLRNSTVANIISQYSSLGFTAWNTSSLNYSSKKQTAGIATRDSAVITVNNTYSEYSCKYTTAGGTIKLYNVTSYFSYPDTVTGWHNIEMSAGYPNNRIEAYNSYFEFTGYQGNVFTTGGSPFEGLGGKLIANKSTFINDNGGKYPPGYNVVAKLGTNTDAEITDCYIRYKQDKYSGYDGLGITFGKNDTTNMKIKIVNTTIETDSSFPFSYGFSASQISGGALVVPYASILGANDFCLIDNVKWITKQNNETRFFTTTLGSYNLDSMKLVLSNHGYYPQELFALHASRTWIPVVSGNTNTDAITISDCLYSLNGNMVDFSGEIEIDPTAASLVQIQLSLPVYSNFSVGRDADGVITSYTGVGYGYISANSSTDKLHIYITPSTTSNTGFKFTGQYFIR